MPLDILQTLLKSEPLWVSMLFIFFKLYSVATFEFFFIINKWNFLDNSNFKTYYFHLDFMGMLIVLDRSKSIIKD